MSQALEKYLNYIMTYANRTPSSDAAQIREELRDHLLKKIEDLQTQGIKPEDAVYQAIEDHGHPRTVGYGLRKPFPLLDVRTHGTARGFIAIGPKAIGIIAVGGLAIGVFSYGAISLGLLSLGLLSFGLINSIGGLSLAPLGFAFGAIAVGLLAAGLLSIGVTAMGLLAISIIHHPVYSHDSLRIISWFTAQNAPNYLLQLKNIANFCAWTWLPFYTSCIVLLTIYLILYRKEHRRIQQADWKLAE